MKMLAADQEYFSREFPEAEEFLREARLRWECFSLACKKRNGWENERFKELLACPACEEQWFINLITAVLAINNYPEKQKGGLNHELLR